MRRCYDASRPSTNPPPWWISGFYPGGMTPTPWSDTQIREDKARFGLPIWPWIGADIAVDGGSLGASVLAWLEARKIPKGITVVVDTETNVYHGFLMAMDAKVHGAGYLLMNYGSLRFITRNPLLSGGRWTADWTGSPHLDNVPGERGTQYANGGELHTDYDASVFEDSVPFWEKRPPSPAPVTAWEDLALDHVARSLAESRRAYDLLVQHAPKMSPAA